MFSNIEASLSRRTGRHPSSMLPICKRVWIPGRSKMSWATLSSYSILGDEDCLCCVYLGRFETRFEICTDENGELRFFRAIQGHSGGMIISPRLTHCVMFLAGGNSSSTTWVENETNTLLQKLDWWQEENNVKKEGKPSSSLLLILSPAMQTKQN